jgi:hypothetical protein
VILAALQRYGMFLADNGIEWATSIAPDERIPAFDKELRLLTGADFGVAVPPGKRAWISRRTCLSQRVGSRFLVEKTR